MSGSRNPHAPVPPEDSRPGALRLRAMAPGRPLAHASCFSCPVREGTEWCDLPDEDLRLLNQSRVTNVYEPGQIVFYQGNPCLGIHCLESGLVALRNTDAQGNSVIARLFHEGQTMGYLAYFAGRGYTGTAEALTRSQVCFVDRAVVRSLIEKHPTIGHRFLGRIADNLKDAEEKRLQSLTLPLRAQVAHLLLTLKDRFAVAADDGSLTLDLPMSRRDVAAMLGARPESLSRALKQLEESGAARFDGRTVVIPDLDALIDEVEL